MPDAAFAVAAPDPRRDAVFAALDRVADPELDESVVALGFVASVTIDRDRVSVGFRLPTYWCSANFAWIMAEDMRDAVLSLPWVAQVSLTLDDHMFAGEINGAIAMGRSFHDAFGAESEADPLDAIRLTFARKAFGSRQLALIEHLLAGGWTKARLLALTVADLAALPCTDLVERYLARRPVVAENRGDAPAFLDGQGAPIDPAALDRHLSGLRSIAVNMAFNGILCRGLLDARYRDTGPASREPELIDFVRDAASARAQPAGA